MSKSVIAPTLIHDVTGPDRDDFTPSRAFALIHQQTARSASDRNITRDDVSTLGLIYAAHFSALCVPFHVERDSVYALESAGYLKASWRGVEGVFIEVVKA